TMPRSPASLITSSIRLASRAIAAESKTNPAFVCICPFLNPGPTLSEFLAPNQPNHSWMASRAGADSPRRNATRVQKWFKSFTITGPEGSRLFNSGRHHQPAPTTRSAPARRMVLRLEITFIPDEFPDHGIDREPQFLAFASATPSHTAHRPRKQPRDCGTPPVLNQQLPIRK